MTDPAEQPQRPLLRVVRGAPDDAELAVLTAVVAGMASNTADEEPARAHRSRWADRAALLRKPTMPGPGAWRAAGFPR
jgi:hypothetical protein